MPELRTGLTINKRVLNRVDLISCSGRVDASTAAQLESHIKSSLEAGRYRLVIDFEGTEYISSAGLKVLVATLKDTKQHRGDVRLSNLADQLLETFKMVGLVPNLFKVYDNSLDAVGSY